MRKPEFKHVVYEADIDVRFTVYAHRQLTRAELDATVANYREIKWGKFKTKKIEIISMIGYEARGSRH